MHTLKTFQITLLMLSIVIRFCSTLLILSAHCVNGVELQNLVAFWLAENQILILQPTTLNFKEVYHKTARSHVGEPNGGRHLVAWARKSGINRSCINATASVWRYSSPDERLYWSKMWPTASSTRHFPETQLMEALPLKRTLIGWRRIGALMRMAGTLLLTVKFCAECKKIVILIIRSQV